VDGSPGALTRKPTSLTHWSSVVLLLFSSLMRASDLQFLPENIYCRNIIIENWPFEVMPGFLLVSKLKNEYIGKVGLAFKGTVQRDFLTPVFFTKGRILVSIDMPRSDFEIFRIFAELFVIKLSKNRLPAVNYSEESKTEP
jgi:hypothetical protein